MCSNSVLILYFSWTCILAAINNIIYIHIYLCICIWIHIFVYVWLQTHVNIWEKQKQYILEVLSSRIRLLSITLFYLLLNICLRILYIYIYYILKIIFIPYSLTGPTAFCHSLTSYQTFPTVSQVSKIHELSFLSVAHWVQLVIPICTWV